MVNTSDAQIAATEDYTLFKTVTGNRSVRNAHVKKIKTSIEQEPETIKYNPILVNEQWEVIDGQHRLAAIKQLGLPVYYIKADGLRLHDVQKLNSIAKQWQPIDYAKAFSKLGNENYQKYVEVKEGKYKEFSLNHDSLMKYLSLDNPITGQSFNDGGLKVKDFGESLRLLKQLNTLSKYYDRTKLRSFALAFLWLARKPEFDFQRMELQFKKYHSKEMEDYSQEEDYRRALVRIYNHNKTEKYKEWFGSEASLYKK